MELFNQLIEQLNKLKALLNVLTTEQYTYKSRHLSGASIGAHSRHIIELLNCAIAGYDTGSVDYTNRQRNLLLETDSHLAIQQIALVLNSFTLSDKAIELVCGMTDNIRSTYYRELAYNLEHIIHHLALIKVSLIELNVPVKDHNFGVAYSTIDYRNIQVTE